ncbi:MAG: hypothetical protein J6K45_03895 [Clostridia bacterium]|nr:hypothetical protein [Clostridia bacterium]
MGINQILAIFFPAIVAIKMHEKLDGKTEKNIQVCQRYFKAVLVINVIEYCILIYGIKQTEFIFTNQFTLKYMVLSIVIAIIYPVIEKILKMNLKLELDVEKNNEEKN